MGCSPDSLRIWVRQTQFALDALEHAIRQRKTPDNKSLVHHFDRRSQYLSIKYTERLAEAKIDLSVGTVGDACDNALAECVIGLFKTEVNTQIGPCKSMREAEWETLKCLSWRNNRHLLAPIGYIPPAFITPTVFGRPAAILMNLLQLADDGPAHRRGHLVRASGVGQPKADRKQPDLFGQQDLAHSASRNHSIRPCRDNGGPSGKLGL